MEFSADAQTPGNAVAAAPRYSPYVPHAGAFRDAAGNYLDGALSYKLTLPAPIPAKDLWALTVYDNLTRSLLPTDQKTGGSRQHLPGINKNPGGGVTVRFGPEPRAMTGTGCRPRRARVGTWPLCARF